MSWALRVIVLAGAITLTTAGFAGAAVNGVSNGGFETGTASAAPPWTLQGAQICTSATCLNGAATGSRYASTGAAFETAEPSAPDVLIGSFSQSVTLPEEPITIGFFARTIDGGALTDTTIKIYLDGDEVSSYPADFFTSSFAGYSSEILPGYADPGAQTLEFRITCHNSGASTETCDRVDLDDIRAVSGVPPGAPTITGTTPASPGDDDRPLIRGTLGSGSADQVRIHRGSTCEDPVGIGSAADFTGAGIAALARENATTTFTAEAINVAGYSPCSNPFTYTHTGPPADEKPPALRLSGPTSQLVGKTVTVRARCANEACLVRATGKLVIRYRLRGQRRKASFKLIRAGRSLPAGQTRPVKPGVPPAARKAARRALRRGGSAVATVSVVARDSSGNTAKRRRVAKLRLPA